MEINNKYFYSLDKLLNMSLLEKIESFIQKIQNESEILDEEIELNINEEKNNIVQQITDESISDLEAEEESSENDEVSTLITREKILEEWTEAYLKEQDELKLSPEYTDLMDSYKIPSDKTVLTFDELIEMGEQYAEKFVSPYISEVDSSESVTESSSAGSVSQGTTSQIVDDADIAKNGEIGSKEYISDAFNLAFPDSNIIDNMAYYTAVYDGNGKLVQLKMVDGLEMTLPTFEIGYPDASSVKDANNIVNLIWTNPDGTKAGAEIITYDNGTKTAHLMDKAGNLTESKFYDKNNSLTGVNILIPSGATHNYRGISFTNSTINNINLTYTLNDGYIAISPNGATIGAYADTDAIPKSKILVLVDGELVKLYDCDDNSSESSTQNSINDSISFLSGKLSNYID